MKTRCLALLWIATLTSLTAGCNNQPAGNEAAGSNGAESNPSAATPSSEENGAAPGATAAKYASPEEVFDVAKKHLKKKDFPGFFSCMTPESQDRMAGMMAVAAATMKMMTEAFAGFGGEEGKAEANEKIAKLDAALAKHGITKEALADLEPGEGEEPPQPEETMEKLAGLIKDKPAFIADVMPVLEELFGGQGSPTDRIASAELADVKIEGETATGVIVTTDGDETQEDDVEFRKIGGGWLIEMPMPQSGGPPPGPEVVPGGPGEAGPFPDEG